MAKAMTEQKFDRFHLRELLNRGGMSEIWLVADGRGKPYALRTLKRELRFSFTARRRFLRGCEILEQLADKDHIVGYVEHGKAEGTCYLLMDYVEAENLKELYARQDPVLTENVAQILIDAATGLKSKCIKPASWMWLKPVAASIKICATFSVNTGSCRA